MALPTALLIKGGIGATTVALGGVAIAKREDIYYFFNPNDNRELNKKIRDLGISGCELENEQTKTKECELDEAKVKAINFTNKTDSDQTVTGLDTNKKLKLVIEKGYATSDFPEELRFRFTNSNSNEVKIGKDSDSNKITLKPGVSYDFKMKSDDKTKLEKAWTLKSLAEKVGLTCEESDSTTECTLKTSGINVWKSEEDYITGATQANASKKICITKDQQGYPEGFKFAIKTDGEDITLTPGTQKKATDGISKLTKENMSYGIDVKEVDGTKTWFLVEKSTPAA